MPAEIREGVGWVERWRNPSYFADAGAAGFALLNPPYDSRPCRISDANLTLPVVPICRWLAILLKTRIDIFPAVPRPQRGASRSSRVLGAGCDGRLAARATSAAASGR